MKPWEFDGLTVREFYLMQQGWNEKDECDWEKVRLECYYIANSQFFSKPTRKIENIMSLPGIDTDPKEYWDKVKEKILTKRKQIAQHK